MTEIEDSPFYRVYFRKSKRILFACIFPGYLRDIDDESRKILRWIKVKFNFIQS